eukprot:scpid72119/ scgid22373/ 
MVDAEPIRTVRPHTTVQEVMTASPSKLRGNVAEQLTAHLVSCKVHDGKLEVNPGRHGRPQVYMRTTKASVTSDRASSRTLRRRSTELVEVERSVCGGETGARAQQVAGLKRLTSKEQVSLLRDAGLTPATPAEGSLLAIKADLQLPWNRLRKLKMWLQSYGLKMESERRTRAFIASTIPQYNSKLVPMASKAGDVEMVPMVYFPSLIDVIMIYLNWYAEHGKMAEHSIPNGEVWLKLGGDHGGGTFKFVMQVANVQHPNSLFNTIPICIFDAQDTPANLEIALAPYRKEINELQTTARWHGRSFRVFFFGDYDYQTKAYGLSGSSGARPCLHCLCQKKVMDHAPSDRSAEDSVSRTLQSLADDFGSFTENGSKIKDAKKFNNVVRPVILHIPVENVVIPALHLDLGIFPWMLKAFQAELKALDFQLARCTATDAPITAAP